jgi:hypothetical protein
VLQFYYASAPPGHLSAFSSRGPTRDGRIKPDITASGENIIGTGYGPRVTALLNSSFDYIVAAGGRHVADGGTSMASPIVAGTAAMYLQKNPTHTYQQVKDAILNCAKTDSWTGNSLPNSVWGYGKVDAFAALAGCTAGINEGGMLSGTMTLFPNPASDKLIVRSLELRDNNKLIIFNLLGKMVLSQKPEAKSQQQMVIDISSLSPGMYFCSFYQGDVLVESKKLVVR